MFLIAAIWVGGGVAYHSLEGWRWLDSLYFSATVLTTVGLGDVHPITDYGKMFSVGYMFIGISVVLYSLTVIGSYLFEREIGRKSLELLLEKSPISERSYLLKVEKSKKALDNAIERIRPLKK